MTHSRRPLVTRPRTYDTRRGRGRDYGRNLQTRGDPFGNIKKVIALGSLLFPRISLSSTKLDLLSV